MTALPPLMDFFWYETCPICRGKIAGAVMFVQSKTRNGSYTGALEWETSLVHRASLDAKDKDKSLANVLFCRHGVKRGQVLRGRLESTGALLAAKNDGTRAELRPQVWESPIPQEVSMCPTSVSTADGCWHRFRTGPSVCSPVHQQNAAGVPRRPKSFMLASMTAFQKKDGGVRSGIPTSTSFGWWRRSWLVSSDLWSTRHVHRSNLHFPPELIQTAWNTQPFCDRRENRSDGAVNRQGPRVLNLFLLCGHHTSSYRATGWLAA